MTKNCLRFPVNYLKALRFIYLVCGLLLLLAGCRGGSSKESITKPKPPLKLSKIALTMEWDANDNWPVSVELVRVKDADLVEELLSIESKDWFGKKGNDFRLSHPSARFNSWELVPGTLIGPEKVKAKGRLAGVLFCGLRKGAAPFRFKQNGKALVIVNQDGCSVRKDSKRGRSSRRKS